MKRFFTVSTIILGAVASILMALSPISASAATSGTANNWTTITHVGALARRIPAQPAAESDFYVGEALWVLYNNSPLRWCPSTNCGVIAYMPATTSLNPGGGWVTLVFPPTNGWCEVNWRNDIGYTGCWRLGVSV